MEKYYQKNADRFKGFADVYDNSRPAMPCYPVEVLTKYLGHKPDIVVDLGCGTGLSSIIWRGNCNKLIGIEPSDDMINEALKKADNTLSFRKGFAHDTGLKANSADIVICSQSFHWMEPTSTLEEVNRILKDGGIFATVDCDWPPIIDAQAEMLYSQLFKKVKEAESTQEDVECTFKRFPKSKHLENIKKSGYFKYSREILFKNTESSNAERLIGLTMSQGSLQIVLKKHPEIISDDLEKCKSAIINKFADSTFDIDFCYRMRIGIK